MDAKTGKEGPNEGRQYPRRGRSLTAQPKTSRRLAGDRSDFIGWDLQPPRGGLAAASAARWEESLRGVAR